MFNQDPESWMKMLGQICLDEDGKRPWHRNFHVRQVGDHRVAVWLGEYRIAGLPLKRSMLSRFYGYQKDWTLRAIFGGGSWAGLKRVARLTGSSFDVGPALPSGHSGPCSSAGFIGIAYLPNGYHNPKSVWPGWKHLAHAILDWQDLLPVYEYILALNDDSLAGLVEGDATPLMTEIIQRVGDRARVRL